MPIQRALQAYRHERHNCAQSIFRGFQEARAIPERTILLAQALGGGWAPEGRCGALHAALELTADLAAKERLTRAFVEKAGSEACREIKKHRKLSCEDCVRLAAEELARL
jgi:hypothetical protein